MMDEYHIPIPSEESHRQAHGMEVDGTSKWTFKIGPTKVTYEGEFVLAKDDGDEKKVKHGTGIMKWEDGREYRGEFRFDEMYGDGRMLWPNGAQYEGQYCENHKGGLGKLTLPDGSSFEGSWYKGMRHGEVLYIDPAGSAFLMEYDSEELLRTECLPEFDGWMLKRGYDVFIKGEATETEGEDSPTSQCSETTCCICLGDMQDGEICCTVPCKHVFHKECIDNWTTRRNQCPLCNQRIPLTRAYG